MSPFCVVTWIALAVVGVVWLVDRQRLRRIEMRQAAALAERKRIARELHDTLGQSLGGAALQIETALATLGDEQRVRRHLSRARELVALTMTDAHRALGDLRAEALNGRDLVCALRLLAASSPVPAHVTVRGRERRLGNARENHLYRIAQEALTNAFRHARANRIDIVLAFRAEGLVTLRIADDGVGLDSASASADTGRYGLRGMRERAAEIGATLTIRGEQGVEITVELAAT